MTATETRKVLYTPAPIDQLRPEMEAGLPSPHLRGLTKKMVEAFQYNTQLVNGEGSYSPADKAVNKIVSEDMSALVGSVCKDVVEDDGHIKRERIQDFHNLIYLAPRLFSAFTRVRGVDEKTIMNIARAALEGVLDPTIIERAVFTSGIGGSDNTKISQRLPVYVVPMIQTVREMGMIFESWRRIREAETGNLDHHQREIGLSTQQRDQIEKQVRDRVPADIPPSTPDFLRTNGIPRNLPLADVFSGASAAAALNNAVTAETVRETNDRILTAYRQTFTRYAGDIPTAVRNGLEWPEAGQPTEVTMSPLSRYKIGYIDSLLQNGEHADFREKLEKRGEVRGGEQGKLNATMYTAYHGPTFDDALNLPPSSYFDTPRPPASVIISDGSKREIVYNKGRLIALQDATPEDFHTYLTSLLANAIQVENLDEIKAIQGAIAQTEAWMRLPREERLRHLPTLGSGMRIIDNDDPPYYFQEPVTLPKATAVQLPVGTYIHKEEDVFDRTTKVDVDGRKARQREVGVKYSYKIDGGRKTVYRVTTLVDKEVTRDEVFEISDHTITLDVPITESGLDPQAVSEQAVALAQAEREVELAALLQPDGRNGESKIKRELVGRIRGDYERLHVFYRENERQL